jgi:hypothetical protein
MFIKDYKKLHAHRRKTKYTISDDYISSEVCCLRWMNEKECRRVLPESKMKFVEYIIDVMADLFR